MYPITEEMKVLFAEKHRQTVNIRVELQEGNTADDFNITEADIELGSFSVDRYCATGENIEIGSAVAAEIKFTLDNTEGKFENVSLGGAKLFVRLGIRDWNNEEAPMRYMDCGYFTVDENPKPLTKISVAALDNMMRFDRPVNWSNFTFPMSIENIISVCCADCDVTLSTSVIFAELPNGAYIVQNRLSTTDITYRQLVQWVAEITGTCAFIDWNGHLRFRWSEKTSVEINPSNRYGSTVDDSITITGVQITEGEDKTYLYGTEGFVFNIEGNELIQNNQSALVQNLGDVLCGFTYVPFECSCFPMPYLYPLDIVSFTDIKGNTFDTMVTAHVYTLNGTSNLKGAGESQQQKNYSVSNPFIKRESLIIQQLKKNAETNMSRIEQETLDLNKALSNALGLYDTTKQHDDGSVTYYYHSKPTLEECAEGDVIFCLGSGGFGVCLTGWNDGNPIFDNGIEAKSGKAIWQYLSAHKLTADLIEAGVLKSVDGSAKFDLDKGQIEINKKDEEGNTVVSAKLGALGLHMTAAENMSYDNFQLDEDEAAYIANVLKDIDPYIEIPPMGTIPNPLYWLVYEMYRTERYYQRGRYGITIQGKDGEDSYYAYFSPKEVELSKIKNDGVKLAKYKHDRIAFADFVFEKIDVGEVKPYYEAGDIISVDINTAGFNTNDSKEVYFSLPLSKPILGSPEVTAATVSGFVFRQNNSYPYSQKDGAWVEPDSYIVTYNKTDGNTEANFLRVAAFFSDVTGAVNNSTLGIRWVGTITFS